MDNSPLGRGKGWVPSKFNLEVYVFLGAVTVQRGIVLTIEIPEHPARRCCRYSVQ